MNNGEYWLSVEKKPGETQYMQLIGDEFMLATNGSTGGAAGTFRVSVNPSNSNQVSLHVTVNDQTSGYVNSEVNLGDEAILVLGSQLEYFEVTNDGSDYYIYRRVTVDDQTFDGYLTAWSEASDNKVYLQREGVSSSGTNRPTQKWKFTRVTIDDVIMAK